MARLALIDDSGFPRALPVVFAISGTAFVSAVDHKPKRRPGAELARVRWARERRRGALTVDHYEEDWSQLAWVQALGTIDVLSAAEAPGAIASLTSKYPQYREQPPGGPVLVLTPRRMLWWRA